MQPNTYYQVSTVQPAPAPGATPKKSHLALVLAIIFAIIAVGLGVFIILDKVVFNKKTGTVDTRVETAPMSVRLSEIQIPQGSPDDIIKSTLAGRTFVYGERYDEYLRFSDTEKYEFSYYHAPLADYRKLQVSNDNGTYKVTGNNYISLSNGEAFTITGDYLVKNTDKLSNNKNQIYFDNDQYANVIANITAAYTSYVNGSLESDANKASKIIIDSMRCYVGDKNLTAADTYACELKTTAYFDSKYIDPLLPANKKGVKQTFLKFCTANPAKFAGYYTDALNSSCGEDYTITNTATAIIRTDNVSYRVTGVNPTVTATPAE